MIHIRGQPKHKHKIKHDKTTMQCHLLQGLQRTAGQLFTYLPTVVDDLQL